MPRNPSDQDTRSLILQVAETQFGAKGYSGTHLQSIAAEVGVQKTALYYYFESKQALYVAVLERMLETFEHVFTHTAKREGLSAETLRTAIDDFNDVLAHNPNFARIIVRIFIDRIPVDASSLGALIARIIDPLLKFYSAGVSAGIFRKMSSRHGLLSLIGAATFYYAAGESSSDIVGIKDIFDADAAEWRRREFSAFVLGGLLPDREDTEPGGGESD
jgi:TetR/AcrR family transcriptional regulator